MFGGERSMYWIEYKFFVYLGSYSRSYIIGIKVDWFDLVLKDVNYGPTTNLQDR